MAKPLTFQHAGAGEEAFGAYESAQGLLLVLVSPLGNGESASLACRTMLERIRRTFDEMPMEDPRRFLTKVVGDANAALFSAGSGVEQESLKSSIVCLFYADGHVSHAHIGDARLYLLRDGVIQASTSDHTQAQQMVDSALLSQEEARDHPFAKVLLRVLGKRPIIDVPVHRLGPVKNGDHYILCSAALIRCVEEQRIGGAMTSRDLAAACQGLFQEASEASEEEQVPALCVLRIGEGMGGPKVVAYNPLDNIARALMRGDTETEGRGDFPYKVITRAAVGLFLLVYIGVFAICDPDCSGEGLRAEVKSVVESHDDR